MIESISYKIASYLVSNDDLRRIERGMNLEVLLNEIKKETVLYPEHLVSFSSLEIPILNFLKEYRNISSKEAKALIVDGYITFEELIKILILYMDRLK
ncbi:MAG: hypothetical protein ACK5M3_08075 [Dysgonomonas sp.]